METKKLHAALLSSPGLGHLIPIIELGKHLVLHHGFDVTVFVLSQKTSPAESEILENAMSPKLFDINELQSFDISAIIDPKAAIATRLAVMMREAKPAFRSALDAMAVRPDVLIVDFFGTEHLIIGDELKIPKYVYIATNASFLSLSVYVPVLDKQVKGEYVDQKEPLAIPGCRPVRPEDVVDPMLDRTNQQYYEYLRICEQVSTGNGILLNTWEDLQVSALAALRDGSLLGPFAKVPIYPIGPLIRPTRPMFSRNREIFDWLDKQPRESVVFVLFGSGGSLSADQMAELAWGLKMSKQRFIWVVRPPAEKTGDGSYFMSGADKNDMSRFLPSGFVTSLQDVGLVVPMWAPQVEILNHSSIGGFLSHCGWNSTLESINNGVPMISWPLYAEQRLNATLLTEEIGVAIRPNVLPSKETISREEIATLVKMIIVGEEGFAIRNRVKELKDSAYKALSKGGSSYESLKKMKQDCETRIQAITKP